MDPTTSPNRAYLAPCLWHSAPILLRRTSDTLRTLYAIMKKNPVRSQNLLIVVE